MAGYFQRAQVSGHYGFFFFLFFFFNLVNKKVDDALQSLPPACPLPAPSMN